MWLSTATIQAHHLGRLWIEGESYLSLWLMDATISAVQPSLCLALTSAPSDNSLTRDRRYFQCVAYNGQEYIIECTRKKNTGHRVKCKARLDNIVRTYLSR
jgi:hypothetical protein